MRSSSLRGAPGDMQDGFFLRESHSRASRSLCADWKTAIRQKQSYREMQAFEGSARRPLPVGRAGSGPAASCCTPSAFAFGAGMDADPALRQARFAALFFAHTGCRFWWQVQSAKHNVARMYYYSHLKLFMLTRMLRKSCRGPASVFC